MRRLAYHGLLLGALALVSPEAADAGHCTTFTGRTITTSALARLRSLCAGMHQPANRPHSTWLAWAYGWDGTGRVTAVGASSVDQCGKCIDPEPSPTICGIACDIPSLAPNLWLNDANTPNGGDGIGGLDDGIDNDANGAIDDLHGLGHRFAQPATTENDEESCSWHLDLSCGGQECLGFCAIGENPHDSEVAKLVASTNVQNPPAATLDYVTQTVGVAFDSRWFPVSTVETVATDHSFLVNEGVTSAVVPTCGWLGSSPTSCALACSGQPELSLAELDGTSPFYVRGVATTVAMVNDYDCYTCVDSQPAVVPLDFSGPVSYTGNFVGTCGRGTQELNTFGADFSVIPTAGQNGAVNATSWVSGIMGGVFAVMCERYGCSNPPTNPQRAAIMQRLCRTANKVEPLGFCGAYNAPWDKGTRLFPGAAWNVNQWSARCACGLIDLGRATTERLSELDF